MPNVYFTKAIFVYWKTISPINKAKLKDTAWNTLNFCFWLNNKKPIEIRRLSRILLDSESFPKMRLIEKKSIFTAHASNQWQSGSVRLRIRASRRRSRNIFSRNVYKLQATSTHAQDYWFVLVFMGTNDRKENYQTKIFCNDLHSIFARKNYFPVSTMT